MSHWTQEAVSAEVDYRLARAKAAYPHTKDDAERQPWWRRVRAGSRTRRRSPATAAAPC